MAKVFISWSGKSTPSFCAAERICEALKLVFHNNDFFFSDHIQKGTFGVQQIFENLSEAKVGIFCVTKANILKPWLNFEAGAITCAVLKNGGCAMPLLIDITKDDFALSASPLAKFQATCFNDTNDMLRMMNDISKATGADISEKDMEKYYHRLVEPEIAEIDINVTEEPTINQSFVATTFVTDELTKDAKKLLKVLYNDYAAERSLGSSISEAADFNDIDEICRLSSMSVDDIRELFDTLSNLGYLKYDSDDNFNMVFGKLTDKGIKYGEDNFCEPTYIILLREIIKQYNLRKAHVPSDRFENFSSDDFSVLKSKGFIDMTKYLNGNFVVKPTDSGIAEIVMRDE